MVRATARLAAISSLIAVLLVAGYSPAYAGGALGVNGPTGEPLPWTLAVVVGVGGLAFVVRAVRRLRRRSVAQYSPAVHSPAARSLVTVGQRPPTDSH